MQLSAKDAWKRILDEAHRELPDHTIRTWLEPTEAIALDEGRLIVGAPDQFAVEWNETKHAALLSKLAEPVVGQPTSIVFRVHEDRHKRPQMDFFVAPPTPNSGRAPGEWSGCEWVQTIHRTSPPVARHSRSRWSGSFGPGSMTM